MTSRAKRYSAAVVIIGAAALGGCAKIERIWDAANKAYTDEFEPAPAPDPESTAQGEEGAGDAPAPPPPPAVRGVPRPSVVGWGNSSIAPANPSDAWPVGGQPARAAEPASIPVVNVFGELDGKQNRPGVEAAEASFQQHTFSDEGYDADVAIDPTGKWMAFASTRHADKGDIYLQRVDGTSVTQLTNDPADDAQPAFSPDGRTIAFCSTRSGSWDLYTMDLDGRNVTQVTSGPAQDMHPSFSPDGRRLAYCSIGARGGQWELWVVDLVSREKRMVGHGLFPAWCPDRSQDRIAFQRARQRGSRWFSLWTLDLTDGEARKVTEVAVSSNAAIVSPSWSPDARRLAFTTIVEPAQAAVARGPAAKGKPAAPKARGQQDVWVVDVDGGNRHRLTDGSGTNLSPHWAPDGRVYFVSDRAGHENIWSARVDPSGAAAPFPVAARPAPRPAAGVDSRAVVGSGDPADADR